MTERHWRDDAACLEQDSELFYATTPGAIREAKAICKRCPSQEQCLDFAQETRDGHAVLGGLTPRQRTKTRAAWRRKKEKAA